MMKTPNHNFTLRHSVTALLAAGTLAMAAAPAHALDTYMGVGLGQSNADLDHLNNTIAELDHKTMAWKVFVGTRVLMFGAELGYTDFGKPNDSDSEIHYKGLSAFGLLYAPIPVPFFDLYAKAGLARVSTDVANGTLRFSTDDTEFAYGLGAQLKLASFAVRGEYEKFKLQGAKPSLVSLSMTYAF